MALRPVRYGPPGSPVERSYDRRGDAFAAALDRAIRGVLQYADTSQQRELADARDKRDYGLRERQVSSAEQEAAFRQRRQGGRAIAELAAASPDVQEAAYDTRSYEDIAPELYVKPDILEQAAPAVEYPTRRFKVGPPGPGEYRDVRVEGPPSMEDPMGPPERTGSGPAPLEKMASTGRAKEAQRGTLDFARKAQADAFNFGFPPETEATIDTQISWVQTSLPDGREKDDLVGQLEEFRKALRGMKSKSEILAEQLRAKQDAISKRDQFLEGGKTNRTMMLTKAKGDGAFYQRPGAINEALARSEDMDGYNEVARVARQWNPIFPIYTEQGAYKMDRDNAVLSLAPPALKASAEVSAQRQKLIDGISTMLGDLNPEEAAANPDIEDQISRLGDIIFQARSGGYSILDIGPEEPARKDFVRSILIAAKAKQAADEEGKSQASLQRLQEIIARKPRGRRGVNEAAEKEILKKKEDAKRKRIDESVPSRKTPPAPSTPPATPPARPAAAPQARTAKQQHADAIIAIPPGGERTRKLATLAGLLEIKSADEIRKQLETERDPAVVKMWESMLTLPRFKKGPKTPVTE
jgi:hypothetical protein